MNLVFVDTAAWIALINARVSRHARARYISGELKGSGQRLVTSAWVVWETANALSAPPLRTLTCDFLDDLMESGTVEVIPAEPSLSNEGWALYRSRPDKSWSLTDCISFVVMGRLGITQAFTSDHHFVQAGFMKLL